MPIWLPPAAVRAFHAQLLAEHGGLRGRADDNLLAAILARPQHLASYRDPSPSLYDLAACYGFGFAKNHCFTDGNKRMALVAIDVFLQLNGYELLAEEPEAAVVMRQVASGELSERELAAWIERRSSVLK